MPAGRDQRGVLSPGEPRWYRGLVRETAEPACDPETSFVVREGESDLWIACRPPLDGPRAASACGRRVRALRASILAYARRRTGFLTSMSPLPSDPDAPPVVRAMLAAGSAASVGPMAAVAGAIAEDVARFLQQAFGCAFVVVENGGDVYTVSSTPLEIAVLAGDSPLSGKVAIRTRAAADGIAVCTSSGTVGPSVSEGCADAATVLTADGALADALATALGNRVRSAAGVLEALTWLQGVPGAAGGLVICEDRLGAWGQLEVLGLPVRRPGRLPAKGRASGRTSLQGDAVDV